MRCQYCQKDPVYKCTVCGHLLCEEHTQVRTVCPRCTTKIRLKYTVKKRTRKEKKEIGKFVRRFWGEEEQLTFDRKFKVSELPGYVAKLNGRMIGFISTVELDDDIIIVGLAILPQCQSSGIGRRLVEKVEREAVRGKKRRLLVSTSNDDLPALAFYQTLGFQIYDVKPNIVAEKHGKVLVGIGGLPIRDELRLQKKLSLPGMLCAEYE